LARESIEFWRDAERRLESKVPFRLEPCGYMFVAHSAPTYEQLAANVRLQNEEGVPSRLVSADEAASLVLGLDTSEILGAAWCSEDGYFDRPQAVVEAFAQGIDVRRAQVDAIAPDGDGWKIATGDGASIAAEAVVVAAGVDTKELLAPLGVRLPLHAEDRFLFLSDPLEERLLDPLVVSPELAFAAKQLADGRVLASDLAARGDPEEGRARWRVTIREGCARLLPRLEFVSFSMLVPGVYDVTPDHQPVLGAVGDRNGLYVACGFSGHGFMISPAVARIVVDASSVTLTDPRCARRGPLRRKQACRRAATDLVGGDGVELDLDEDVGRDEAAHEPGCVRRIDALEHLLVRPDRGVPIGAWCEQQPCSDHVLRAGTELGCDGECLRNRGLRLLVDVAGMERCSVLERGGAADRDQISGADAPRVRGRLLECASVPHNSSLHPADDRCLRRDAGYPRREMTEMRLYDLRVTVERIEGPPVCGLVIAP
jgi:sarcosine oxidase subunit beta